MGRFMELACGFAGFMCTSCSTGFRNIHAGRKYSGSLCRLNLEDRISMGNRIALWLENVDLNKPVYIYFDKNRPVYAITVEPGHYRLIGFAGIDMTHRILGRRAFHGKNSKETFVVPFEARTNSAVYIGDFIGYAKVNLVAEEWALKTGTNNFAGTTIEFHKEYPNLANLPVFSVFESQP